MTSIDKCAIQTGFSREELEQYAANGEALDDANVVEILERAKVDQRVQSRDYRLNVEADARIAPQMQANAAKFSGGKTLGGAKRAVKALLGRDLGDGSKMVGIDQLTAGYLTPVNKLLAEAGESFKTTIIGGMRNKALMDESVKVAMGATTANGKAQQIGKNLRSAMDKAHEMYQQAGGTIGKVENYFPQTHMRGKLLGATLDGWKADIKNLIDRNQMKNSNGDVLDDKAFDELLDYVYASITTQGRENVKVPKVLARSFSSRIATRHNMSRVLHFKDPDSFLKYNASYGNDDLWGTLTNHLKSMATDTALHRTFGADVEGGFRKWKAWASKQDGSADVASLDAMWNNLIGFEHTGDNWVGSAGALSRDIVSTGTMGTAVISSWSDIALTGLNSALNDMKMGKVFSGAVRYSEADRLTLTAAVGHLDYALSAMAQNLRFEDTLGSGLPRRMADANYRLSGMTAWMERLRHGWMGEMLGTLSRYSGKEFDKLPKGMKGFLETYGLEKDWDKIRAAGTDEFGGGTILSPSTLGDDDLIARLVGAIHTERDLAVLHPDVRVRAAMNQGLPPGSAAGELVRAMGQFKTFPTTMIMHGVGRYALSGRLNGLDRAGFMASMIISMTLLGAASFQMKEMLKGRDPRDMNTADFWGRAFAQGGAMPMFMELILDGQTQYGGGWIDTVGGPTGAVLGNVASLGYNLGSAAMGYGGEEAAGKAGEQLMNVAPFSSMWWGREAAQRLVTDNILDMVDPSYKGRQKRKERNRENKHDQGEFWSFGDSPDMPDFGAALGN